MNNDKNEQKGYADYIQEILLEEYMRVLLSINLEDLFKNKSKLKFLKNKRKVKKG